MTDALIAKIDELIAVTRAASIPDEKRWIDAEAVSSRLSYAPRYVMETLAFLPDFPKPMRADGEGHPRWLASEIDQWALARRDASKPRKQSKNCHSSRLKI